VSPLHQALLPLASIDTDCPIESDARESASRAEPSPDGSGADVVGRFDETGGHRMPGHTEASTRPGGSPPNGVITDRASSFRTREARSLWMAELCAAISSVGVPGLKAAAASWFWCTTHRQPHSSDEPGRRGCTLSGPYVSKRPEAERFGGPDRSRSLRRELKIAVPAPRSARTRGAWGGEYRPTCPGEG
jgi:hypothetical protein